MAGHPPSRCALRRGFAWLPSAPRSKKSEGRAQGSPAFDGISLFAAAAAEQDVGDEAELG